jgi:hypothetical protein
MAKLHGAAKREFLARMEAGRRKKRGHGHKRKKHRAKRATHHRSTRHRATHHHTQHHHTMAKKKRKSSSRRKSRRSHHRRLHHGGLLGASGGSLRGRFLPTTEEAIAAGTAGVYGYLEGAAAKDKEHFLAKMPVPIATVGRSGTVALGLWLAGALTRRRFVRCMARGVVDVATYQMFRRPSMFGTGGDKDVEFTLGRLQRLDKRTPQLVVNYLQRDDDDDDD